MAISNLKLLVGRLNDECWRTLDDAGGLCIGSKVDRVEIEHWIDRLLGNPANDFNRVLEHFDVDVSSLQRDVTRSIERMRGGGGGQVRLSTDLIELIEDAWLFASVDFGEDRIRSGHLLCSLLLDRGRDRLAREISGEFQKVGRDTIRERLSELTESSTEVRVRADAVEPGPDGSSGGQVAAGGSALDRFTVDLTELARAQQIDRIVGRDGEIRQLVDILMRRRQNNPILTGEAGVGKTAVVEGFAQRIADGDVPPGLRGVSVRSLDLGLLQAGASVKGEFENRLRGVIEEIKASPTPIILFIDEAHMLVGAGGPAGQADAANLMKPALARGELRTIAATTWAEYKKYFEKDPALTRRFQVVKVDEPDEPAAVRMMEGLAAKLESHHGVRIMHEAIEESVRLSSRFISGRQLPDKAVSVLDTACARVAVARTDVPAGVESLRRRRDHLEERIARVRRESVTDEARARDLVGLEDSRSSVEVELADVEERWRQEMELVDRIVELRHRLEGSSGNDSDPIAEPSEGEDASPEEGLQDPEALHRDFIDATERLRELQGDDPLISPCVDRHAVAAVVSSWTGIPVGRMASDEVRQILELRERLEERVVGQSHAMDRIARTVRPARADIGDPEKPLGVFLLPGPSGVGKTETALALADLLYAGRQSLVTINMSEFKEEHRVSMLVGSPQGYVGFGEGGVLTEAVRRTPYSVVLLDEMEKAHPGVQDIFYQVFDKGVLRDGEGREIDFRNTVVIMTSNAASGRITAAWEQGGRSDSCAGTLVEAIFPELLQTFKPAFLGRCTILPYLPLADDVLRSIVELKLEKVTRRVRDRYDAEVQWGSQVLDSIVARCTEVQTGARNIDHIVERSLLPELAGELLLRVSNGESVSRIEVGVGETDFVYTIT